ncbi:hypothetical protein D3C87_931630 [compost metagenome]
MSASGKIGINDLYSDEKAHEISLSLRMGIAMSSVVVKGTVRRHRDKWFIENNNRIIMSNEAILDLDSILMGSGDYMLVEGDEVEVTVKIKRHDELL